MEKPYTFKGQSLENRPSCIFQAIGNILVAEAATKVKAKKKKKKRKKNKTPKTEPRWSQICSSLLQEQGAKWPSVAFSQAHGEEKMK